MFKMFKTQRRSRNIAMYDTKKLTDKQTIQYVSQYDYGYQLGDILIKLIKINAFKLIIIIDK